MALVGAGAIHYGDLLRVPLTTVSWNTREMGQQAARLLLERIDRKERKNGDRSPIHIQPELVVRESCGAATWSLTNKLIASFARLRLVKSHWLTNGVLAGSR